MKDIEKNAVVEAVELGITLHEYKIARATLDRVLERLKGINACTGCTMKDICDKYGKPAGCLKCGFEKEISDIIRTARVVVPDENEQ